jgi:hypothetical protein
MAILPFDERRFSGIYIDDAGGGFFGPTAAALMTLARSKIGYDLLDIISKRARGIGIGGKNPRSGMLKCVIRRGPGTLVEDRMRMTGAYRAQKPDIALKEDMSNAPDIARDPHYTERRKVKGANFSLPGSGSSAVALWEPMANYNDVIDETPGHIAIGHELIHCMHFMSGDTSMYADDDPWGAGDTYSKHEEARTVGLGIYANTRISENALRREFKLKLRTFYTTPGDCDGLTSAIRK